MGGHGVELLLLCCPNISVLVVDCGEQCISLIILIRECQLSSIALVEVDIVVIAVVDDCSDIGDCEVNLVRTASLGELLVRSILQGIEAIDNGFVGEDTSDSCRILFLKPCSNALCNRLRHTGSHDLVVDSGLEACVCAFQIIDRTVVLVNLLDGIEHGLDVADLGIDSSLCLINLLSEAGNLRASVCDDSECLIFLCSCVGLDVLADISLAVLSLESDLVGDALVSEVDLCVDDCSTLDAEVGPVNGNACEVQVVALVELLDEVIADIRASLCDFKLDDSLAVLVDRSGDFLTSLCEQLIDSCLTRVLLNVAHCVVLESFLDLCRGNGSRNIRLILRQHSELGLSEFCPVRVHHEGCVCDRVQLIACTGDLRQTQFLIAGDKTLQRLIRINRNIQQELLVDDNRLIVCGICGDVHCHSRCLAQDERGTGCRSERALEK